MAARCTARNVGSNIRTNARISGNGLGFVPNLAAFPDYGRHLKLEMGPVTRKSLTARSFHYLMDSTGALVLIEGVVSAFQQSFARFTCFEIRPSSGKGKRDELAITVETNPSQPAQNMMHLIGPALR
jgi:hypothetical protein